MTISNPCVVCKENRAEQKHHLSYNPELIIDVCKSCHEEIHKHGVGRGVRLLGEEPLIREHLTYEKMIEDKHTILDSETNEILNWLVCSCGMSHYHIYSNKEGNVYLRCNKCGQDYKISIGWDCP